MSFDEPDEQGRYDLMRFHQSGMEFEVPRKGTALAEQMAPVDLERDQVRDLLGHYYHPERETNIEVSYKDHRLYLLVPGMPPLELLPPEEKDAWVLKVNPSIRLDFDRNEAGEVVSMIRIVGEQTLIMPRVAETE